MLDLRKRHVIVLPFHFRCHALRPRRSRGASRGATVEIRDAALYGRASGSTRRAISAADLGWPRLHKGTNGYVHTNRPDPAVGTPVWRNGAAGCVVGPAGRGRARVVDVPRLLGVGGVSKRPLHVRAVPLPVLLAGDLRQLPA